VAVGAPASFQAVAVLSDGTVADVTLAADWSADGPTAVTGPGQVHVLAYPFGPVAVSASLVTPAGQLRQGFPLEIIAPVEQLVVSIDPPQAFTGDRVAVQVMALRVDGSAEIVTDRADIAFPPGAATPAGAPGLFDLTGAGSFAVQATFEGVTGTGFLDVQPVVVSIAIDPSPVVVEQFQQVFVQATATMSDGTQRQLFQDATWLLLDPIGEAQPGLLTAFTPGTTVLVVAYPVGPVTVEGRAQVSVLPAPVGLVVTPDPATIGLGETATFTATATFTDGSTRDVTAEASWQAFGGLAPGPAAGTFVGLSPGRLLVNALWHGFSANAHVEVLDFPTSLTIIPGAFDLTVGGSGGLVVFAQLASGGQVSVADLVAWSSDDAAVAEAVFGIDWRVVGHAVGTTVVRAAYTLNGRTATASAPVTVAP
jgi:hypothetical protein